MIISVVNRSKQVSDDHLLQVIRAVNRQVREDFEPYWSMGATLRLEGRHGKRVDKLRLPELRGDAVLYLADDADVADAIGYHDENARGIPFGFIFTEVAKRMGEDWSVTLSHEALELIGDPLANLLVSGPHPHEHRKVFYWVEMADPVQSDVYEIEGVKVSNFLLPSYFDISAQPGGRHDFLGAMHDGKTLVPFGINPGGYLGYFDPKLGKDVTIANYLDEHAKKRLNLKKHYGIGRRKLQRHAPMPAHPAPVEIEVLE
jgi:hypothetical protein